MTKASDNEFPSVLFDEQAGDPATPATGFWRAFFKSGGLYIIDDAGAVTGPLATGGGSGQGLVDFASLKYTAGDITCDADGVWEDLGIGDLTITASSGQWVQVGLSLVVTNTTAVSLNFDCVSIVSAAPVNSFASGTTPSDSNDGVSGWRIGSSAVGNASGSILYQLQAGDITGGTVVARIRDRPASSTNRVVAATAAQPIHFWIMNLGGSL